MKPAQPQKAAPAELGANAAVFAADAFLEGGEIILRVWKPSPLAILLAGLPQLAVIAALAMLSEKFAANLTVSDRALGALALAAIILTWHLLDWLGKSFILTDRRALRLHGVVNPSQVEQVRLRDIEQLELRRNFLQQAFGLSGLLITPSKGQPLMWEDLGHGQEVQAEVAEAVRRHK